MLSYVLLISMALILAIGAFVWLKSLANVGPVIDCKEGTSVILSSYSCNSGEIEGGINLVIENNGRFNLDGILFAIGEDIQKIPIIAPLKENFQLGEMPGHYVFASPLKPGDERTIRYTNRYVDSSGKGETFDFRYIEISQIQPFILVGNDQVLCKNSIIKQKIEGCRVTDVGCFDEDGDEFDDCAIGDDGDDGEIVDCDDNDALEYPGQIWYLDGDGDGYSSGTSVISCERPLNHKAESELTAMSGDCDDDDANINPGSSEECNGVDDDCDENLMENENIHSTLTGEICDDEFDNDCDGLIDCGDDDCDLYSTCAIPFDNLVSWWKFNGDASDDPTYGEGNDGTISGGVSTTTDRFESPNSAYSFDGIDGYIQFNKVSNPFKPEPDRKMADPFTITIWAKVTSFGEGKDGMIFVSRPNENVDAIIIMTNYQDNKIFSTVRRSRDTYGWESSELDTNNWYFLAGTWDPVLNKHYFYINGDGQTMDTDRNHGDDHDLQRVGSDTDGDYDYNGAVDDVMIFDKILSSEEINKIYNSQKASS